jgi:hypothetical protein
MTDARFGAAPAAGGNGLLGFLAEALASLRNGRLLLPMILLVVLLTASNIVILLNRPVPGEPPVVLAVAALVRVFGLFALTVALLRVLGGSSRPPFRPDGAFWLYSLTVAAGLLFGATVAFLVGGRADPATGLLAGLAMTLVSAPFAAWFAAIAVERPLAARPGPWMRGMGRWLPALLLWSILVVVPLGQLHAQIDNFLIEGAGRWFWPLALVDGPLSALFALFSLALAATAYRRVARG